MPTSKAAQAATRRYEAVNYDQVRVLLPKGTKELIKSTGETVNGFINRAVAERLQAMGIPVDETTDK